MIGVNFCETEKWAVKEFFQLFKTPWEPLKPGKPYDIVISTTSDTLDINARLLIVYHSKPLNPDASREKGTTKIHPRLVSDPQGIMLPIYEDLMPLHHNGKRILVDEATLEVVALQLENSEMIQIWVGFNLFNEIAHLLTSGQPSRFALIPTVDLHISLLRKWIVAAGIHLVEIPPSPYGYRLSACLTHDVDFWDIRRYWASTTIAGFIARGLIGSVIQYFHKNISIQKMIQNWISVFKLPLIFLGLAKDEWGKFDRYIDFEKPFRATFFLIPYKNDPGEGHHQKPEWRRAVRYDIADVIPQVNRVLNHGSEIGLHGLNAWHNANKATQEKKRILENTNQKKIGIRMHWLYYDKNSPEILDQAGFDYDATRGYNEAVGFMNGTTQVFSPPNTSWLLELPLNIQDTALFSRKRMALNDKNAFQVCQNILDTAYRLGGVVTLSWHERSLVPERQWGDFYNYLLRELHNRDAYVQPAHQIVSWFRQRRSIQFESCGVEESFYVIKLNGKFENSKPPPILRLHLGQHAGVEPDTESYIDIPWDGKMMMKIPLRQKGAKH